MFCDDVKPALLGQENKFAVEELAHRREIAWRKKSGKAIFQKVKNVLSSPGT